MIIKHGRICPQAILINHKFVLIDLLRAHLHLTIIFSLASYVSPEKPPSSGGDRKKWEAGIVLVPSVAQQTLEQTSFTTIGEGPLTKESAQVVVSER